MGIVLYLLSQIFFPVIPLPILINDPRLCLFSPCGWLLTPWVVWNDIRNLLWHYHVFKALQQWIPAIGKIIISLFLQTPILPLLPELEMPHLVTASLFSLSEVHQTILVSLPISSWSFLHKSPKNKGHHEPSVSKPCSNSQMLFLTCSLQILSITPLNPLIIAAVNAKLCCIPTHLWTTEFPNPLKPPNHP